MDQIKDSTALAKITLNENCIIPNKKLKKNENPEHPLSKNKGKVHKMNVFLFTYQEISLSLVLLRSSSGIRRIPAFHLGSDRPGRPIGSIRRLRTGGAVSFFVVMGGPELHQIRAAREGI